MTNSNLPLTRTVLPSGDFMDFIAPGVAWRLNEGCGICWEVMMHTRSSVRRFQIPAKWIPG